MKRWIKAVVAVLGLGLVGFGVAASGVVPIAASAGHWDITAWLLHFSMRRSVATHSLGIEVPVDLVDPALRQRGAGHYHRSCRPCHGAPGWPRAITARSMTPAPPMLVERVGRLDPAALFYVVKHGVKFTGMPAWPTQQRDDEVWAVTAFLTGLPELAAEDYRALVQAPTSTAETTAGSTSSETTELPAAVTGCVGCHGVDGQGRTAGAFPKLAGQSRVYLEAALQAYAEGERPSGMMEAVAVGLSPAEREAAARYYAQQAPMRPARSSEATRDGTDAEAGQRLAAEGIPERRIPACAQCHGPAAWDRNPAYPSLLGQDARYLRTQLGLFASGVRGGAEHHSLMEAVPVHRLEPAEIEAVADYYGRQEGTGEEG